MTFGSEFEVWNERYRNHLRDSIHRSLQEEQVVLLVFHIILP
jgi:hypothetical protein